MICIPIGTKIMFSVLVFKKDNSLGIVREEWLTPKKKETFWPPYKNSDDYKKCLHGKIKLDEKKWPLHAIKKIYCTTSFVLFIR